MGYFSDAANAQICADPSLVASFYNPTAFAADLAALGSGVTGLNSQLLAAAYAAVIAWNLKPYGEETSAVDLAGILAEPTLACDSYARLAYYLTQLVPQAAGVKLSFVGWEGGVVGNHVQILATYGSQNLLLDPTIGLVARTVTYDKIAGGKPIAAANVASFFVDYGGTSSIAAWAQTVGGAVISGGYKPSDALYYFASFKLFCNPGSESNWPTPAAAKYQPQ